MFARAGATLFGVLASLLVAPGTLAADPGPVELSVSDEASVIVTVDRDVASIDDVADALGDEASVLTELDTVVAPRDVDALDAIASLPGVTISENSEISLAGEQAGAPWNLSRLDQWHQPVDSVYRYPAAGGQGARVYIIDTGISPHPELGSRLLPGATAIADGRGTADCNGHGTHVAGSVAAKTWGVAKSASVVPVRVFGCAGTTTVTTLLSGLDWIMNVHPSGTPGIINMSLSGPANSALDEAIERASTAGFIVVAAAGNSGRNACLESPARADASLTVAATTNLDVRPSFSNFGTCVDLFAPGSQILSLRPDGSATPVLMSGTSMAAPHVAGIAALIWSSSPSQSASAVTSQLVAQAIPGIVQSPGSGSPNLLASAVAIDINMLPGAVNGLRVTSQTTTSLALRWTQATAPSAPVIDYTIQYRRDGTSTWLTANDGVSTQTVATIRGLTPGSRYEIRIRAATAHGFGPMSSSLSTATRSVTPGSPQSVRVNWTVATGALVSWNGPAYTGTAPVTDYRLQIRPRGSTSWQTIADGVSTHRSHRVGGLRPNTQYEFRVAAINRHGVGAYSAALTLRTRTSTPSSPTSVRVRTASATQPTIGWTAPSWQGATPITDYAIQYRRAGSGSWITVRDGVSATASARIPALRPNTAYEVRVRARNSHGVSAYSTTHTFRTRTLTPSPPTAIRVARPSATQPTIGWTAPSWRGATAVTDYTIQYRRAGTGTWLTVNDGVSTSTSARIPSLRANTTYEVRVRARNSHGAGAYSAVSRFQTPIR